MNKKHILVTLLLLLAAAFAFGGNSPEARAQAERGDTPLVSQSPQTCPPANCTAGRDVGRDFFVGVIDRLSDVPTSDFAVDALMAWEPWENTSACWNPLATTRYKPGSCDFNSAHVKNYLDQTMGMEATAETLALSYYTHIRAMLRLETFNRSGLRSDLQTWGTCSGSGCDPLLNTWQGLWDDAQNGSGDNVIVVEDPAISPSYGGMCGSAWYRFSNNRGHYAYLTLNTDNPAYSTNSATWTPNLPTAGTYKVEAYIAHHNSIDWQCPSKHIGWDTSDARYTIYHANGHTTVSGNQGPLDNQWLDLGTYAFNAGTGGKVKLTDLNGESHLSHTVSFSAVRFTLIDSNPPPPSNDVVVEDPGIHPSYNGMCGSAWYRFSNNRGHYAYLTLNTNDPGQSTNWAEWKPNLPRAGTYKVQAYIAEHNPIDWQCPSKHISWDTSDARYTVYHADGSTTVSRDQAPLNNQWLTLGTWFFDSGNGGRVKLTDLNGEANLSRTVSFSAMRFVFQSDTTPPWGEITSPTGMPTWSGSTVTLSANAADNSGGSGIGQVHFWVRYADSPTEVSKWHSAGDASGAPYSVQWSVPSDLRSQLIEVGIHVEDRAGNYCVNPDPRHNYQCDAPESKEVFYYQEPGVTENWLDADLRAYLNQRSLSNGDEKCAAASAAMFLAMNNLTGSDYDSLSTTANAFYNLIPDGVPTADNVAATLNYYGADVSAKSYRWAWSADALWDDVQSAINTGSPVILLSRKFTNLGHHVVIVGYREKNGQREFIVYDPYGRWQGTSGQYDRNSDTANNDSGDTGDSYKGRWVWYSLDSLWDTWGSSLRPYAILPSWITLNVPAPALRTTAPSSPPDLISDEGESIGAYEGVPIEYQIYLPLTVQQP